MEQAVLSIHRGEIAMWLRFHTPLADAVAERVRNFHKLHKVMPASLAIPSAPNFPKPIPDDQMKTMQDAFDAAVKAVTA